MTKHYILEFEKYPQLRQLLFKKISHALHGDGSRRMLGNDIKTIDEKKTVVFIPQQTMDSFNKYFIKSVTEINYNTIKTV